MQTVRSVFIDGALGGGQSLGRYLAAKEPKPVAGLVLTTKNVSVDPFEIEHRKQFIECFAHVRTVSVAEPAQSRLVCRMNQPRSAPTA